MDPSFRRAVSNDRSVHSKRERPVRSRSEAPLVDESAAPYFFSWSGEDVCRAKRWARHHEGHQLIVA